MIATGHKPMRQWLAITLAALWLVTLASANTAVTPAMHCQGHNMPCCPRSGNHAQCSPVQCAEQAFQKSDSRDTAEAPAIGQAAPSREIPAQPSPSRIRELTPGLCCRAAVFRLKDDLRI